MERILPRLVAPVVVVTLISTVSASTIEPWPFEEHVRRASLIVVGTYEGELTTSVHPRTRIPTRRQVVRVSRCLGVGSACPDTVVVSALGGPAPAYGADGQVVLGPDGEPVMIELLETDASPHLARGEHVLLLSTQGVARGVYRLCGARAGMLPVHERDGDRVVAVRIRDWELLSQAGKNDRGNVRKKTWFDRLTADARSAGRRPHYTSTDFFYLDVVPLDELQDLIDRALARGRRPHGAR